MFVGIGAVFARISILCACSLCPVICAVMLGL
jgi:hypothetical protein